MQYMICKHYMKDGKLVKQPEGNHLHWDEVQDKKRSIMRMVKPSGRFA